MKEANQLANRVETQCLQTLSLLSRLRTKFTQEHPSNPRPQSVFAFTLAEILIVLGIVGVVAGITIPALVSNVTTQTFNTANTVFIAKLKEMTNQMSVNDELTGYTTNEGFADTFARYAKVSKRCNSTNLTSCFVPKFTNSDGLAVNTTSLTKSQDLTTFNNTNPLVGFTLINGTNIIMAYDPTCASAEADKYKLQADKTYCMSLLYDTNASSGPNKMGKDILTLNAKITPCDGQTIDGLCIALTDSSPQSINTCNGSSDIEFDLQGSNNSYCNNNYWAGAKKSCKALSMHLPDNTELAKINTNKASIQNINISGGWYWSSTESNVNLAYYERFSDGNLGDNYKYSANLVRCVR